MTQHRGLTPALAMLDRRGLSDVSDAGKELSGNFQLSACGCRGLEEGNVWLALCILLYFYFILFYFYTRQNST